MDKEPEKITVGKRILLHLAPYSRFQDDIVCPRAVIQPGIADKLGISRGHVASELRRQKKEGYVTYKLRHLAGAKRRRRAYFLTHKGELCVMDLKERIKMAGIAVVEARGAVEDAEDGMPATPSPSSA